MKDYKRSQVYGCLTVGLILVMMIGAFIGAEIGYWAVYFLGGSSWVRCLATAVLLIVYGAWLQAIFADRGSFFWRFISLVDQKIVDAK